eukprot:g11819.t1
MDNKEHTSEFLIKCMTTKATTLAPTESSLIKVFMTATLPEALSKLKSRHIVSAPVMEGDTHRSEDARFTGRFIDLASIASVCIRICESDTAKSMDEKTDKFKKRQWRSTHVSDIFDDLPMADQASCCISMLSMLEHLAETHRVALYRQATTSRHRRFDGIITCSAAIEWLHEWGDLLPDYIRTMRVANLKPISLLVTIQENRKAMDGFAKLKENPSVLAMAVVDGFGVLKDSFNLRDLRALKSGLSHCDLLYETVSDFKRTVREKFHVPPVQTCERSATFLDVLQKMCDSKAHEVFILNKDGTPFDCLYQQDVIEYVLCGLEVGGRTRKM